MSDDTIAQAPAASAATDDWQRPVWLVEHPTHQYAEDVKALARLHGLRVVDPAAAGAEERALAASAVPALTLVDAQAEQVDQAATPRKAKKAAQQR
ncbi:MAG: hypothetical protein JNL87_12940 [Burkholderiaceae bacterium]|nr:hypothetical protein [Burkholderiaceae bacterium]